MNDYEKIRAFTAACTVFIALLLVIISFHQRTIRMQMHDLHAVTEQTIVQEYRQHRGKFRLACAMKIVPVSPSGPEPKPNAHLQAECEIVGESDDNLALTIQPYLGE